MQIYSINTGFFKLDGGAMFGVVPKSIWNKLNPADENNLCTWALRCLLILDGDRKILVDTGMGNKQDAKFFSHYQPTQSLSFKAALAPFQLGVDDITDVILTHLHFDHVGGAIELRDGGLKTVFPNAVYWVSQPHWEWAMHPNKREKASFLKENIEPLQTAGQLRLIQVPPYLGKSLQEIHFSENISLLLANGHTQSMMLPKINCAGKTLVYMADLLPSVGHIPLPYVMGYDMQPLITLHEKESFLQDAVKNNYTLFFEHDPMNECCNLIETEKGIRAKDVFSLEEWMQV